MFTKKRGVLIFGIVLLMFVAVGCGQESHEPGEVDPNYPTKSITYTVPFDPGGQSDVEARRQQPMLEDILGTSIVVTYKSGGGGAVGWAELVNARPDGYSMTGINIPHIILQPASRENAGYTTEQINPVAFFQATPIGLAVPKDSPYDTLEEFIAYAKENPGAVTVGGSGTYTGHHIAQIQFEALTGVELSYVPFTGAAPQMQAFLGGHVAAIFGNSNSLVQYEDDMKILAIGSTDRFEALPDVPTFIEKGYNMTPSIDRGVAVPPGTPEEYKEILADAFIKISSDEQVRAQMIEQGFVPLTMDQDEAKAFLDEKTVEYLELLDNLE